ncbi:MAG TPA: DUF308 domain-containing protein [Stellaceae bacterium]
MPGSRAATEPWTRSRAGAREQEAGAAAARSGAMSAVLARNWWLVGLRALAAGVFVLCVALLPPQSIASLVVLFAAYVAADGALAILAGLRAARRGERWWSLILEGTINLAAAAAILVWPVVVAVPFVSLTAAWAIITGALLFAAAHRLALRHGRWLVVFGGAVSVAWGLLAATVGPAGSDARTIELWLAAYAVIFGATMLILSLRLQRRHGEAAATSAGP